MERHTGTDGLIKAFYEAEKMQKHLASTGALKIIADIQKMHDRSIESSMLKAVAEMQKSQECFASTGALKAMADMQKEREQNTASMLKAAAEAHRVQEHLASGALKAIIDTHKLHEQYTASGVLKAITEAQNIQKHFTSAGLSNTIMAMQNAIKQNIPLSSVLNAAIKINEVANQISGLQFTVNSTGTITAADTTVSISQIENISKSCINESNLNDENISFEIRIANYIKSIAKQHPVIRWILIRIILSYLISNSSTTSIINNTTININLFKNEVNKMNVDEAFHNNYRFVSAKSLSVWSKNTIKSKHVGKLYFGELVKIVSKKKNWSLIEYKSKDGEVIISGWVLTRYIKRFD